MAYLMQPFQQVMPYSYMPPSAIPMNMLFPTQPYYYAPAWPVYQWTESDGSITELPPGDYPHRESDLRQDGGSLTMQQMLMYYDPMVINVTEIQMYNLEAIFVKALTWLKKSTSGIFC